MKIRQGFVSNSSSSSFVIWGAKLELKDFENIIKTFDENIQEDIYNQDEVLCDFWEPKDLEIYEDYDNNTIYIGRSWSLIKDDETGLEFKNNVETLIKEYLGKDIKCYNINTTIYN